jgi:hypothetical protein
MADNPANSERAQETTWEGQVALYQADHHAQAVRDALRSGDPTEARGHALMALHMIAQATETLVRAQLDLEAVTTSMRVKHERSK